MAFFTPQETYLECAQLKPNVFVMFDRQKMKGFIFDSRSGETLTPEVKLKANKTHLIFRYPKYNPQYYQIPLKTYWPCRRSNPFSPTFYEKWFGYNTPKPRAQMESIDRKPSIAAKFGKKRKRKSRKKHKSRKRKPRKSKKKKTKSRPKFTLCKF